MSIEKEERNALKAKADLLGIDYHPNISAVKLAERIKAFLEDAGVDKQRDDTITGLTSEVDIRRQQRLDATRQVRIVISCMNPAKKDWQGEVFTCGNTNVGTHSKFVPFNVPWHVPTIIYKMIKRRKYQQFIKVRGEDGEEYKKSILAKEFTVEELDPLTPAELKHLAAQQSAANGTEA